MIMDTRFWWPRRELSCWNWTWSFNVHNACQEILSSTSIPPKDNKTRSIIGHLKRKLIRANVLIPKADKGNSIVLINRAECIEKTYEALTNCGAQRNHSFNFEQYVQEVRKIVKNYSHILHSDNIKKSVLISNPVLPSYKDFQKSSKRAPSSNQWSPMFLRPFTRCLNS